MSSNTSTVTAAVVAPVDSANRAGIIFRNGDKYLLVRGKPNWEGRPGKWGFPKGHVHEGETFEDGAIREALEETGIVVHRDALNVFDPIEYPEFEGRIKLFCIDINRSASLITIPRILKDSTNEIAEYGWFTRRYMKNNLWQNINRSVKPKWYYDNSF
jgi:8-oxo-dGTP pyrophosphatase MutT (NUDIX family)